MIVCLAAVIVAMVSLQFGASTARGMFVAVGAPGATALRLVFAATMLACVLRPWRGALPRAIRPALLGYGVALGCMNLLFYLALRGVPLGVAVALEFLGPLVLTLVHSRRWPDVLWVGLAGAGLAVLLPLRRGGVVDPVGAVCALGAGACWAAYIVCGRRIGPVLGARAAALGMLIAAAIVAPIGLLASGTRLFAPGVVVGGLVVAAFSSAVPYVLEIYAMSRLETRLFGTLMSMEPAIAALMGWAVLHQSLSLAQWGAIGAIMAAAAGAVATGAARPGALPLDPAGV